MAHRYEVKVAGTWNYYQVLEDVSTTTHSLCLSVFRIEQPKQCSKWSEIGGIGNEDTSYTSTVREESGLSL